MTDDKPAIESDGAPVSMPPPKPAPMEHVVFQVKKLLVGQDVLLERLIVALLARGHVLVEGVPGLAKTMAIKTLAADDRRRLPAHPVHARPRARRPRSAPASTTSSSGEFQTSLGPVHTNLLLADEINRAPAKVQSALLEVMQERQVTIGRETLPGARSVPGDGHAEPDRVGGHLSRCPRPSSTGSCSRCSSTTRRRPRSS